MFHNIFGQISVFVFVICAGLLFLFATSTYCLILIAFCYKEKLQILQHVTELWELPERLQVEARVDDVSRPDGKRWIAVAALRSAGFAAGEKLHSLIFLSPWSFSRPHSLP